MVGRLVSESSQLQIEHILTALKRLDQLLEQAVIAAQNTYGVEASTDAYRGLYINQAEVERLLSREPGQPLLWRQTLDSKDLDLEYSPLTWLRQTFRLSDFDLNLILIALAPEIDLRYERLYAYLQDDVTRKHPTVDLVLNLLCASAEAKLLRRTHFSSSFPLVKHRLLHLIPDPNQIQPPLLSHYLKLDGQVVRLLLGQTGLDPRLIPYCQQVTLSVDLEEVPFKSELRLGMRSLLHQSWQSDRPLKLYFQGSNEANQLLVAKALASEVNTTLITTHLGQLSNNNPDFEQLLNLLFREAWFQRAILYLDGLDALRIEEKTLQYNALATHLAKHSGVVIVAGTQAWTTSDQDSTGLITVPFDIPDFDQRRSQWQACLTEIGTVLPEPDLDTLADRFHLLPSQITSATIDARNRTHWRILTQTKDGLDSSHQIQPTLPDLFAAARSQSGSELKGLARKIEPLYTWDDLVLPAEARAQLQEISQWVNHRHQVFEEWGFDHKLSLGRGISALFAGPSGTGKTMSAEIIAKELGLDLYKINLSSVVSKYIGETEKNLERIFTAAEQTNAILFFDEADALFGKRSEVRDAHDRYANIEIAYLLQRMEQYEGITILASNLRQNLDDAFIRRLQFIVEFPFPDEAHRQQIWQILMPAKAPQAEQIDYPFLAKQFRLSGGNIKNIVLAAAFLAAADHSPIGMTHLIRATWRECQKLGQAISKHDFGDYAEVLQ
jgi:SpoVK/Ycf46/Vps4 family AAA+-type ATPase